MEVHVANPFDTSLLLRTVEARGVRLSPSGDATAKTPYLEHATPASFRCTPPFFFISLYTLICRNPQYQSSPRYSDGMWGSRG